MRAIALLALLATALLAACGDDFGPLNWLAVPDTATIYSLARTDLLGLPAGMDFVSLQPVRVEQPGATGAWDVALSEQSGEFVLVPAGALPGIPRGAGIAVIEDQPFEALQRAPGDTAAYARDEPVPLRLDVVYVVRTGSRQGSACIHFAKVRPLEADAAEGSFRFEVIRNPLCSDRYLVPPDER